MAKSERQKAKYETRSEGRIQNALNIEKFCFCLAFWEGGGRGGGWTSNLLNAKPEKPEK